MIVVGHPGWAHKQSHKGPQTYMRRCPFSSVWCATHGTDFRWVLMFCDGTPGLYDCYLLMR